MVVAKLMAGGSSVGISSSLVGWVPIIESVVRDSKIWFAVDFVSFLKWIARPAENKSNKIRRSKINILGWSLLTRTPPESASLKTFSMSLFSFLFSFSWFSRPLSPSRDGSLMLVRDCSIHLMKKYIILQTKGICKVFFEHFLVTWNCYSCSTSLDCKLVVTFPCLKFKPIQAALCSGYFIWGQNRSREQRCWLLGEESLKTSGWECAWSDGHGQWQMTGENEEVGQLQGKHQTNNCVYALTHSRILGHSLILAIISSF